MTPSSDFSVAPDSGKFCPEFALPAYTIFSFEQDYVLFVASDFRRNLTVSAESSAVPGTWRAYGYIPTSTDNNDSRLGVLSATTRTIRRSIYVASTYDSRFSLVPIYESPLVDGPSLYSSPCNDMLSMYPYSILPHHGRDFWLNSIRGTLFDLQHKRLFAKISALSAINPFRPVRVPTFPVVMFSTDASSFPERRRFSMVDWSACPVRIAPFQRRLFANVKCALANHSVPTCTSSHLSSRNVFD